MIGTRFYIVDVFAEQKYAGNQLAVFRNARAIGDADMQRIAQEMHFSETTFILSEEQRDGGYDVRIFTPEHELPFAGHPTLGTAYVIQQAMVGKPVERLVLNLQVGRIPVTFLYRGEEVDLLWMQQKHPTFGASLSPQRVAGMLNLAEGDLDERFPVEEVSTGVPILIIPLKSADALKRAGVVREDYFALIENIDAKIILVFCPEVRERANDLAVRVFADYYGVPEDPATGAANGCLAGYLVKHRYFGGAAIDIRVEQGHEIGRPSLLFLRAKARDGEIDVSVGGRVIMTAKGELV